MYELNKHPLSLGYCKMAALEGLEEKLSTIWYIEIPTHFTSGLGNLTSPAPPREIDKNCDAQRGRTDSRFH